MGRAPVVWGLHADGHMFPMAASTSCGVDGGRRYYTAIIRELVDAPAVQEDSMTSLAERNASTAAGKPQ